MKKALPPSNLLIHMRQQTHHSHNKYLQPFINTTIVMVAIRRKNAPPSIKN